MKALPTIPVREFNSIVKDSSRVDVLFGYCYPSTYRAGMTGLALQILYSTLNAREDTSCERYFRHQTQSPSTSIESGRQLRDNHIVGFTLTYEEDILNLIQMIEAGNIPCYFAVFSACLNRKGKCHARTWLFIATSIEDLARSEKLLSPERTMSLFSLMNRAK